MSRFDNSSVLRGQMGPVGPRGPPGYYTVSFSSGVMQGDNQIADWIVPPIPAPAPSVVSAPADQSSATPADNSAPVLTPSVVPGPLGVADANAANPNGHASMVGGFSKVYKKIRNSLKSQTQASLQTAIQKIFKNSKSQKHISNLTNVLYKETDAYKAQHPNAQASVVSPNNFSTGNDQFYPPPFFVNTVAIIGQGNTQNWWLNDPCSWHVTSTSGLTGTGLFDLSSFFGALVGYGRYDAPPGPSGPPTPLTDVGGFIPVSGNGGATYTVPANGVLSQVEYSFTIYFGQHDEYTHSDTDYFDIYYVGLPNPNNNFEKLESTTPYGAYLDTITLSNTTPFNDQVGSTTLGTTISKSLTLSQQVAVGDQLLFFVVRTIDNNYYGENSSWPGAYSDSLDVLDQFSFSVTATIR